MIFGEGKSAAILVLGIERLIVCRILALTFLDPGRYETVKLNCEKKLAHLMRCEAFCRFNDISGFL